MVTGTSYTPPVTRATFRRSAIAGAIAAAVALVVTVAIGHVAYGVFACLGIALGVLNNWLVMRSVARFTKTESFTKVRFSGTVLVRIAAITLLAFACALLFRPAGIAVFGGLAVFQLIATVSSALPLIKEIRRK